MDENRRTKVCFCPGMNERTKTRKESTAKQNREMSQWKWLPRDSGGLGMSKRPWKFGPGTSYTNGGFLPGALSAISTRY